MIFPEKLERYLSVLERHLEGLPASHRISIINLARDEMERKLEDLSFADNNSLNQEQYAEETLKDFIPMESWLNSQLQARGLQLPKRKSSTNSKLFFSLVGLFLFFVISTALAIWHFTPIIEINDETGNISFLGGQLNSDDIKEIEKHFNQLDWAQTNSLSGQKKLNGVRNFEDVDVREIHIDAPVAALVIKTSSSSQLRWTCQTQGNGRQNLFSRTENEGALLDLSSYSKAKCVIELPQGIPAKITATQLKLNSESIAFPLDIIASYGQIEINTDNNHEFEFDLKNNKGPIEKFASSNHPDRYLVKIALIEGAITKGNK